MLSNSLQQKRPMGSAGGDPVGKTTIGDVLRGVFKAWIGAGIGGAGGQVAGNLGGAGNQQFSEDRGSGLQLQGQQLQQPILKVNDPMNPWNMGY